MTNPQIAKLKMRCARRGIKEMDVIMGKFALTELDDMPTEDLNLLEIMLEENDHDLLGWILSRAPTPDAFAPMITKIKRHHGL